MNPITRRATLAGASVLPFVSARAQTSFPDRPVRLIIPWAAGGPADGGFRILADSASKKLGQPMVVENKAGASGILGAMALQDAKPDGYVISQMHMSVLRQPLLNKSLAYHPINDLTYILRSPATSWAWWCVPTRPGRTARLRPYPRQSRQDELGHPRHRLDPTPRHGARRHRTGWPELDARPIVAPPTRCVPCWRRIDFASGPRAGRR
jgi:hypothetical protein